MTAPCTSKIKKIEIMSIYRYFIFCWRHQDWPTPVTQDPLPSGLLGDEI